MIILFIIIGFSLIVFMIWNLITLYRLKKNSSKTEKELNDSKYFELKYKTEFFVAVFSVIVAVAGLLGYDSLQNAKNEIKRELLIKTKSIDSILVKTEQRIKLKDSVLKSIELKHDVLINSIPINQKKILEQNYQIHSLQKMIEELNSNNKIKQNFYIVNSLGFDKNKDTEIFKYQDLKTNIGDKLPKFTKTPFVIGIPEVFASVEIHNVTLDGFAATIGIYYEDFDTLRFSVMIIENK